MLHIRVCVYAARLFQIVPAEQAVMAGHYLIGLRWLFQAVACNTHGQTTMPCVAVGRLGHVKGMRSRTACSHAVRCWWVWGDVDQEMSKAYK
jgi:hypothetical protein